MDLKDDFELEATRNKLRRIQRRYESTKLDQDEDPYVRELSLQSLKRLMNQLAEEIARYEAHRNSPTVPSKAQ